MFTHGALHRQACEYLMEEHFLTHDAKSFAAHICLMQGTKTPSDVRALAEKNWSHISNLHEYTQMRFGRSPYPKLEPVLSSENPVEWLLRIVGQHGDHNPAYLARGNADELSAEAYVLLTWFGVRGLWERKSAASLKALLSRVFIFADGERRAFVPSVPTSDSFDVALEIELAHLLTSLLRRRIAQLGPDALSDQASITRDLILFRFAHVCRATARTEAPIAAASLLISVTQPAVRAVLSADSP